MQPASDEDAQQACQTVREECLATLKPPTDNCPNTASCSLPVSRLVRCINSSATLTTERALSVPTCENLTRQDLSPPSSTLDEECVDFFVMCPDL